MALIATKILFDQRLDKGFAYNAGTFVASGGVSALIKTGGKTTAKKVGGVVAKGSVNTVVLMSGAAIDSAFQAHDSLVDAGIDPNTISSDVMAQIGLAVIAESDFSYNSETNELTATIQSKPTTGSRYTRTYKKVIGLETTNN